MAHTETTAPDPSHYYVPHGSHWPIIGSFGLLGTVGGAGLWLNDAGSIGKPIMTVGIALPLLVGMHGASAAPLAAIGMLTGYCGTLMTPMAANYNIVPAALLELRDQYAVIRQQALTGALLFVVNVVLLYVLPFRNG